MLSTASLLNQWVFRTPTIKRCYIKRFSLDESCIQQIKQKKQSIKLPSDAIEISFKVLLYFTRAFLSIFLPETDTLVIEKIADNINVNIMGLAFAMDGCYQFKNLLEQWEKDFFLINSEKMKEYYRCTFPDIESLHPVHGEVGVCTISKHFINLSFNFRCLTW